MSSSRGAPVAVAAVVVLAALLAAGCAGSGRPSSAAGTTEAATVAVSAAATRSVSTSRPPRPATSPPAPPASGPAPDPTLEPPPAATLVAGAARHPGEPASWAWAQGTNDAPWLAAAALEPAELRSGRVRVEVADDVEVESWVARAATAEDTQGSTVTPLGDGQGPPSFDAPEGEWVVAVDVTFAGGLGSAVYYWYLIVE